MQQQQANHYLGDQSHSEAVNPVKYIMGSSYSKSNQHFQMNHQLFRQACHQTKSLNHKDLNQFNDLRLSTVDFSKNGDFFVCGTGQGTVALWRTVQFLGIISNPKPTLIIESLNLLSCFHIKVTTSPDDRRIISNDCSTGICFHDVNTGKLLHKVGDEEERFIGLGVQPQNRQGDIIAATSKELLRINDIRRSRTDPLITAWRPNNLLHSAAFSPKDETIIAVTASKISTELIDLRKSQVFLRIFPTLHGSGGVHFNGPGTRLLSIEAEQSYFSLYNLDLEENTPSMRLTAPGFITPSLFRFSEMRACFAGRDGEFVAGTCRQSDNIHIWSTRPGPDHHHNDEVQPLLTLRHKYCRQVCYNESTCTLVSAGNSLQVWTPFRLPELISSYIEENGNTASRHGSDQENLISEPNENDGNSNRYEEEAEMSSSSGGDGGSVSVSISTNDEDSDISIGEDMNTSLVQSSSGLWRVE